MHPLLWLLVWFLPGLWPSYLSWRTLRKEGYRHRDVRVLTLLVLCGGPVSAIMVGLFQHENRKETL